MNKKESNLVQSLVQNPEFIFKFALYIVFIVFAFMMFFIGDKYIQDKSLKTMFSSAMFLYGAYRLIRTYQDFKQALKSEND